MPRPKHLTAAQAQAIDAIMDSPALARAIIAKVKHGRRSCRKPGEFKPGGGRYEKKTCVPRRKARKPCHKKGQFKPGGGRYETTSCRVTKKRRRSRSVRGTAGMSI